MTNEEAIKQLEITQQCDVDTVAQIKALNMAIVALQNCPTGEALTMDQLREMEKPTPVWAKVDKKTIEAWGGYWCICQRGHIITPGLVSMYADKMHGVTFYPYPPAHIDREAWEPCYACKSCGNCNEAWKATGEKINYAHPCHSCLDGDNFKPVAFCRVCGRPLTSEAWTELEKRIWV